MKVSLKWLKELVDLGDMPVADIAHRLTMGGLEVEEITPVAPEFSGIVALSPTGTDAVRDAYRAAREKGLEARFHEAPELRRAALTDLLQDLVERDVDVRGVLHWKGWMEVDTFEDYRRAWAEAEAS